MLQFVMDASAGVSRQLMATSSECSGQATVPGASASGFLESGHRNEGLTGETIMLQRTMFILVFGLLLAGCGTTTSERALSGAGIGAAVGAGGAAVTGGSIGTGAVIGGAVGAAAGALTDESQIDLDD
jgi:osmotically inducible lipoprotein OsmB